MKRLVSSILMLSLGMAVVASPIRNQDPAAPAKAQAAAEARKIEAPKAEGEPSERSE